MRLPVTVLLGAVLAPVPLLSQQSASYGFIGRLGRDTLVVEQVTRSAGRIESRSVGRTPQVVTRHWVADLAPDGTVRRMVLTVTPAVPPANAPREQTLTIDFGPDSLAVAVRAGDSTRTLKVAARGPVVPWLIYSYASYELLARAARKQGGDSVNLAIYSPGSRQAGSTWVRRLGADSMAIGFFGDPIRARVDAEGGLLGMSGEATTIKMVVSRVPAVDVDAAARAFVAAQASGPVSALSPRDTARATAGSAEVWVDYGRPAARGRQILGNVVPWDAVWRTGANAATQLSTSRDLEFEGGLVVPAGKYTLWTLPTRGGVSLIVNRQTGQWGTEYQAAQDLGRVAMTVERNATPVEVFTVRVESGPGGGRLVMEWDTARWVAAFRVR